MADKIRGITIEIGGDTSDLTKSLKGVNGEISSTSKQLKDVEKLLKLDPTNTELLRQKHELLTKQVEQTKEKLDDLKKLQETMDQNGVDKNSEQYQALQREIIATEDSLHNLETAAQQSSTAMAQVAATCTQISEGASKVADKTRALSTAAAGLLVGIGKAAYDSVVLADDLNTLAKQTGFTTEELQKMNYAADLIDVSTEDITSSMTKLKKSMYSTSSQVQEAFEALGIKVKTSSGQFRDAKLVYWEVIETLGQVTNETERDTLAMTLLGKSADQLAGIVDDGGAALRELGDEAERAGLIMSQDTLDSLNAVNDEIDTLKATAKATLSEAGAKAIEALAPAIESIVNVVAELLNWIGSLDEEQIQLLVTILAIVAVISPIASIIAGITSAVASLITVVGPALATIITFLAANPIVLAIAAIVAAIAALTVFFVENWEYVKMLFSIMGDWINSNVIQPVVSMFKTGFTLVYTMFTNIVQSIVNVARSLVNGVIGLIESAINVAIDRVNAIINAFNSVVSAVARFAGISYGGISNISKVKLPKLASGGILSSGSAIVGEAGPELLTMVGNKAQVTPLTATLSDKTLSALSANNSGRQVTTVNVEFTGSLSQLASVLHPYINAETHRIGASLING